MATEKNKVDKEDIKSLNRQAESYHPILENSIQEIKKEIVGQDEIIEKLLIAVISNGHVLLEGVPGLAKTLMIKTLSDALKLTFKRIQFTPDLLPADIIGTKIYNHNKAEFLTKKGPIFNNFILADEINRAPPKVQSALLEAMQEKQVTIGDETHPLQLPFLVFATQNPLETEGTYTLPEAQIDRFMFKLIINYPNKEEEKEVVNRNTTKRTVNIEKTISQKEIKELQDFAKTIYVDESIVSYVIEIVDATRNPENYGLKLKEYIEFGASPRASIWLIMAAKTKALIEERGYVIPEDIMSIAKDVLRHRIILTYEAEAENIDADNIIATILNKIKVP